MTQRLPLWPHQREAVRAVEKYLDAFRTGRTQGAALVHMPTGAGKTGVIAALARCVPRIGGVLILSPRIGLRDQLQRDVSHRFFSRLGIAASSLPKRVVALVASPPRLSPQELSQTVLVATIQKLHSLARRSDRLFDELKSRLDLVVVDEGHCEPAPEWRTAIRAIAKPKVIFTATPYRNDLKLFDIDFRYGHSYTLPQAVKERYVRQVEVHIRQPTRSPAQFINEVVDFYERNLNPEGYPDDERPRVIIRCDSPDTIRQIAVALERRGQEYVAIHERFSDRDPQRPRERQHVPDPSVESATFWIHQFKLLEGIDDPRFQLLALYEDLKNGRALVQQIGRVIRNPGRTPKAVAYVLDHTNGRQKTLWESYLQYENLLQRHGLELLDLGASLIKQWQGAHPAQVYLDGTFRERLELDGLDPDADLQLPLTMNVFAKAPGFSLDRVIAALEAQYVDEDRVFRTFRPRVNTAVLVYISYTNSPLLRSTYFMEPRLGVTIVRGIKDFVCYFESGGVAAQALPGFGEPVLAKSLRKLFHRDRRCRLTSVSLRNSNLGVRALRSRAISASSIQDALPTLDDHAFACTTAQGYSLGTMGGRSAREEVVRRYVGFLYGRVTDASVARAPLDQYLTWLDEIAEVLESRRQPAPTFSRYASDVEPPADPTPVNVLLDVADVQDRYVTTGHRGVAPNRAMVIKDLCADVGEDGSFTVVANGVECNVHIEPVDGRYRLDSPELDDLFSSLDPEQREGLITFLNRSQSFRVIPKSEGVFYTLGQFFRPHLEFDFLVRLLEPAAILGTIGSEKGDRCLARGRGWQRDCLFGIIDTFGQGTQLRRHFGDPQILICDDMGTESADFILGNTNRPCVVLIHAKALPAPSYYSASNLQEVCGQASKNLLYLSKFSAYVPSKANTWHREPWRAPGVGGYVASRIRRGPRDGRQAWRQIQSIIRDPRADCEVWLMLGQLLSAQRFESALDEQKPEALQAALLLFSTLTDVASQGARLRVFCSP